MVMFPSVTPHLPCVFTLFRADKYEAFLLDFVKFYQRLPHNQAHLNKLYEPRLCEYMIFRNYYKFLSWFRLVCKYIVWYWFRSSHTRLLFTNINVLDWTVPRKQSVQRKYFVIFFVPMKCYMSLILSNLCFCLLYFAFTEIFKQSDWGIQYISTYLSTIFYICIGQDVCIRHLQHKLYSQWYTKIFHYINLIRIQILYNTYTRRDTYSRTCLDIQLCVGTRI